MKTSVHIYDGRLRVDGSHKLAVQEIEVLEGGVILHLSEIGGPKRFAVRLGACEDIGVRISAVELSPSCGLLNHQEKALLSSKKST